MPNTKFNAKSFNPEAFRYMVGRVPNLKINELKKSRALAGNPDIKATFASQNGTEYARIAMRGLLDGDAVNYDGQTDITATSTKTFEQGVIVVGRAKAWIERDFSYDITGGVDFMANIAQQVAQYKDGLDQDMILAILKGVFAMTGAKNLEFVSKHTSDISGVSTGVMTATTMNTATNKACGANKKKFTLAFMHSDVSTNLENLKLLEHLKYTDKDGITRELDLGSWNGKLVIIDDDMPTETVAAVAPAYALTTDTALDNGKTYYTRSGNSSNYTYTPVASPAVGSIGTYYERTSEGTPAYTKYTTYVMGNGAISYEDVGVKVPFEMARDAKTNGGEDTLYMRQRKVFAPYGISYEKASQATNSPTNTELETGDNWSLVHSGETTENTRSYRMASTGSLTGFTTPQILGLSAAFNSLGINAEAGGSASAKLMKKMELAAEVGGKAEKLFSGEYGSAIDFSHFISSKENLLTIASDLDVTTDYVEQLGRSWLDLENFADVSGKTANQFKSDWGDNPAQGMLDFFADLGELDASGQQSAVSMLNEMGIDEIRLSNLIAASAFNSDLVRSAIFLAEQAYNADLATNALNTEYDKFANTKASQNAMLSNKLDNSMADLGENVIKAVQPALDKVNELLTSFNSLSEVDQDKIVNLMGALIIAGPSLIALGTMTTAISKIAKGFQAIQKCEKLKGVLSSVSTFITTTPVGVALALAAAVGLIAAAIDAIPTKAEQIAADLLNIPITLDQTSYDETMVAIDTLQAKIDELKGNPAEMQLLADTSESVKMGYGTNTMYGNALIYEAAMFEDQYESVANDYSSRIAEATQKIVDAEDAATKQYWLDQVTSLEAESKSATNQVKQAYTQNISDLYNGMVSQYPELASKLERASKQYDLLGTLQEVGNFEWESPDYLNMSWDQRAAFDAQKQVDWNNLMKGMYTQAFDAGFMSDSGFTLDQILGQVDSGTINNAGWIMMLQDSVLSGLKESVQTISDNPIVNSYLQSILDNPALMENLDATELTGAMDGIFKALDFKTAMETALQNGDANTFGAFLTQGLADGIDASTSVATTSATTMGTATVDALGSALGVNSPSIYGVDYGVYIDDGLALGITNGTPVVTAAVMTMGASVIAAMSVACNQTVATASSILSYGAGASIGGNMVVGLAAGILAGKDAAVAAARSVAAAAAAAMRVSLKIHSPSKITESYGEYFTGGFAGGILNDIGSVEHAVAKVSEASKMTLQDNIWSMIGDYNGLEFAQMQDPETEVKISETDLKKVRTLAEREIINQFTTAELKIEYTNNNTIKSDFDVDELFDQFGDRLAERVEMVAGGVYE